MSYLIAHVYMGRALLYMLRTQQEIKEINFPVYTPIMQWREDRL